MREGWKCPVCGRGVSPDQPTCDHGEGVNRVVGEQPRYYNSDTPTPFYIPGKPYSPDNPYIPTTPWPTEPTKPWPNGVAFRKIGCSCEKSGVCMCVRHDHTVTCKA